MHHCQPAYMPGLHFMQSPHEQCQDQYLLDHLCNSHKPGLACRSIHITIRKQPAEPSSDSLLA
jgi:hypothetical protein